MALSFHSRAQFPDSAEEMNPHRRFVQAGHFGNVPRGMIRVLTQHEYQPLAAREAPDCRDNLLAPLTSDQKIFRRSIAGACRPVDRVPIATAGVGIREHPTGSAHSGFLPIEAAVDQDAREPDLKGQVSLKGGDVHIRLHKSILNGFVGLGGVAEIMPGNARRPPLLTCHDLREQVPGSVVVARRDQILDLCGEARLGLGPARAI
jgi:hypothetical protein